MVRLSDFEANHPGLRVDLVHVIDTPPSRGVDVSIVWEDVIPLPVSDIAVPAQRAYRVVVREPNHPLSEPFADWLIKQAKQTNSIW